MKAIGGPSLREGKLDKLPWKNTRLLRAVQERASSKENKKQVSWSPKKKWMSQVGHLPGDLIFKVLLLVPAESLCRSSFVCKEWFNLINSSTFIEAHISQSEFVLIFLNSISQEKPKSFSIEANLGLSKQYSMFSSPRERPRSYIHFLELQDGKGKIIESNISGFDDILATCNGLILATTKQIKGLLVMNPMTRKVVAFPLGTIVLSCDESYGFLFSYSTSEYKVVHLFRDEVGYIGCEILSLATRSWRAVDGPSLGDLRKFVHKPVSAIGALHWFPTKYGSSYIVSFHMDEEKFLRKTLPISSSKNDRLVEIGRFLSFVTLVTPNRIEVWILKGLCGDDWIKQHSIRLSNSIRDLIPISTLRKGREMVFKGNRDSFLYAYDFELEMMRKVEMEAEGIQYHGSYVSHVNTLASWGS